MRALVPIASTNPQFTADLFDKRANNPHSQSFAVGWINSLRQTRARYGPDHVSLEPNPERGYTLSVTNDLRNWPPQPIADDKTIADFGKDNGPAIKKVCARFIELCRKMGLLTKASVAIDGSKFKAVNTRDKNFTKGKVERRRRQLEERVARYLA